MSTVAAIATIAASLFVVLGPALTVIYRNGKQTRKGVEWLLEVHNYPNPPPDGHYWPQIIAVSERSHRVQRN